MVGEAELGEVGGVQENPVSLGGEVEWNALVGAAVVHALSVLVAQLHGLPAQVHLGETFSRAGEALIVRGGKGTSHTVNFAVGGGICESECVVPCGREGVEGLERHFVLSVRP